MEKKLLVKYTDVQICREELTILKHINFELYSGEFVYFILERCGISGKVVC